MCVKWFAFGLHPQRYGLCGPDTGNYCLRYSVQRLASIIVDCRLRTELTFLLFPTVWKLNLPTSTQKKVLHLPNTWILLKCSNQWYHNTMYGENWRTFWALLIDFRLICWDFSLTSTNKRWSFGRAWANSERWSNFYLFWFRNKFSTWENMKMDKYSVRRSRSCHVNMK